MESEYESKTIPQVSHVYSVPFQTSKMERFPKSEAVS